MKLSLHIGTPKTGTTSCQRWFSQNRATLYQQGVIYSQSLGGISHRALAVSAQDPGKPNRSFAQFGIKNPQDHADFCQNLQKEFSAEIARHKHAHHWLISSEHLYSNINSPKRIIRIKEFLQPYFDEITIYLHLRPQVDLLLSGASQRARMGREVTLKTLTRPAVGEGSAYFNYERTARHWADIFGAGNLRLIPFRRQPDITEILIRDIGIHREKTTAPLRTNEALGWKTMGLVNALGDTASTLKPLYKSLFLDQQPKEAPLRIGLETAHKIQNRFTNSNAQLCQAHPEILPHDLEPDWSRFDAPANLDRLTGEAVYAKQLAYVIKRYQQELRLEQARTKIAQAELLWHKGEAGIDAKLAQVETLLQASVFLPELHNARQKLQTRKVDLQKQILASETDQP